MDRMTDSGSVGWAFESPRDHKFKTQLSLKQTVAFDFIDCFPAFVPHSPKLAI